MNFTSSLWPPPRRAAVWGAGLLLAVAAGAAVTDGAERRLAALAALRVTYAAFDPWTDAADVPLGPAPPAGAAELGDGAGPAARIAAAWPGGAAVSVEVEGTAAARPLPFAHEDTRDPRFRAFAERFRRLPGGPPPDDPFALCDFVHRQSDHGTPDLSAFLGGDLGNVDPAACLALAERGEPMLCHHAASLLAHGLLAAGFRSRTLGLSRHGRAFDHAVTEAFVPGLRRWVLLDPDFDLAYRRGGRWLSAADLHAAVVAGDAAGVEQVSLGAEPAEAPDLLPFYRTVFYAARTDRLTSAYPVGHPVRVRQYVLWDGPPGELPPICPEGRRLDGDDLPRLAAAPGAVRLFLIGVRPGRDGGVRAELGASTVLAGFSDFAWGAGGGAGHTPAPDAHGLRYGWTLRPGANELSVRAVDLDGRPFPPARVRVTVRPRPSPHVSAAP